ncbi:MAG: GAF and ANTAR domain-containing protein [Pseudolysinimonas sp.]
MPGTRAALSTLGATFGNETLCASDDDAARLDELQIDLGEGPSWQSVREQRPVFAHDIRRSPSPWPIFAGAAADLPTRAVLALPLTTGTVELGALGLYSDTPETLSRYDLASIGALVDIAATQVLRRTFSRMDTPLDETYSRREVHQATGMVVAQLGVTAVEALVIIQAHAFAAGLTVRALAGEIVGRRIDLSDA